MSSTTNLNTLKINYLTQEQYEDAVENEEINENELYFTPGHTDDLVIPSAGEDHISYTSVNVNKKINLYYKNGIVTLSLRELKDIPSGMTLLCTVPTKFVNTEITMYHDVYSNGQMFRFIIEYTGNIYVYNYGSAITGIDNSCFLITYVTY